MSAIDDLRTALTAANEKADANAQQISGLQESVDGVQHDVQTLLDRLNNVGGIPNDVVELANTVNTKLGNLSTALTAVSDDIKTTPKPPTA